jgi:hypothetical protein
MLLVLHIIGCVQITENFFTDVSIVESCGHLESAAALEMLEQLIH